MLYLEEIYVNRTESRMIGGSGVYETYTEDRGELFRSLQQEYGRCVSKIYIDTEEGTQAIGWVFVKRTPYTDVPETYLQETWCTLHEKPPVVHEECFYAAEKAEA